MSGGPVSLEKTPPENLPEGSAPDPAGAVHARRFWSGRRLPAVLVAAVVLGLVGAFLYDVAAVRAGRPAMHWRRGLAHELATRSLGDPWVITGAVVAVLAGLWLIALALTPGLRGVLPMRRDEPGVRAGLDRRAAALVLRDRAMEVPGVQSVRAEVGRRRIRVRAQSHFRDLDDVRRDVGAALAESVRELGLARQPRLSVHVSRPAKK
ncbi:membrane protein [Streptomyces sp. NRRL B-1568]|nr:membrane protein [Streptomyces sp. NRRL B-1568]